MKTATLTLKQFYNSLNGKFATLNGEFSPLDSVKVLIKDKVKNPWSLAIMVGSFVLMITAAIVVYFLQEIQNKEIFCIIFI